MSGTHDLIVDGFGDILVTSTPRVVRVDPVTGLQSVVHGAGQLVGSLTGIALETNGDLLFANRDTDTISRIDPNSGSLTLVTTGGLFIEPFGIAVVPSATQVPEPSTFLAWLH